MRSGVCFLILLMLCFSEAHAMNAMECNSIRQKYLNAEAGKLNSSVYNLSESALDEMRTKVATYLEQCQSDWAYYGKPKIEAIVAEAKDVHEKPKAQPSPVAAAPVALPQANDPTANFDQDVTMSQFYKDCAKVGKPSKEIRVLGRPEERTCKVSSGQRLWFVTILPKGQSGTFAEWLHVATEDNLDNPQQVAFTDYNQGIAKDSEKIEPQMDKAWKAALLGASNHQKASADLPKCNAGDANACQRLFQESKQFDPALIAKACSLKVMIACEQQKNIQAADAAKQQKAQAAAAKVEKQNSGACKAAKLKAAYCANQNAINVYQKQIDHEKMVEKETGVVNTYTLHNAASIKITLTEKNQDITSELGQLGDKPPTSCGDITEAKKIACGE